MPQQAIWGPPAQDPPLAPLLRVSSAPMGSSTGWSNCARLAVQNTTCWHQGLVAHCFSVVVGAHPAATVPKYQAHLHAAATRRFDGRQILLLVARPHRALAAKKGKV